MAVMVFVLWQQMLHQQQQHPLLNKIVDDISGLSLLQAADLVTLLKSRLNIQEIAMPTGPAAPVAAAPVEDAAPVEEAKPKEKTVFNVTLEKFDAAAKPKIIKEIKNLIPNMNLMEAKKFVESVPKVLKENIPKEDAEKLQKTLEALGATITLS
ncbi:ClpS-like protein [Clavulina sp. PMI_390]|nr:ClpS-like protein [Clavulina sp. PMI_390]